MTYTLYPSGNGDLRTALSGLKEQFPLRNLHWKSTSRTALRTIQEVHVKLVDLGDLPPSAEDPYASVLENPMVNLCFVACDVGYPTSVLPRIADWRTGLGYLQEQHAHIYQGLDVARCIPERIASPAHRPRQPADGNRHGALEQERLWAGSRYNCKAQGGL